MKDTIRYPFLIFIFGSFCFFQSHSPAVAQKINLVIAADVNAPDIGPIAAIDRWNVERLFLSNVPSRQLSVTKIPDEKMAPEAIGEIIDALIVGSEDVLVFYYSGHSSFDTQRRQQFFELPYGTLYRDELLERLQKKSPRLVVLLTDCCNIPAGKIVIPRAEIPNRPVLKTKVMSPLFDSLFLKSKGTVDVTSSKQGEFSFCDTRPKGNRGSCFTYPMVDLIDKNRDNTDMNWEKFITKLSPAVNKAFRENYPEGFAGQTSQTVAAFDYPGKRPEQKPAADSPPAGENREKYRFGTRAAKRTGGGFLVIEVFNGSPAQRSGLEPGDVILEINDEPVDDEEGYSKAVDDSGQDMKVKLIDVRTRKTIVRTIRLGW